MSGNICTPFLMMRHGQTEWNREGRYQGQVDVPLNELGREQASSYGKRLAGMDEDWSRWHFVASPLGRARETMEIVRSELGLEASTFQTDERLIEISYGTWERQRLEDLREKVPDLVAWHEANKWDHAPPGGESYSQAVGRVSEFLGELASETVVVCHGGVIRATRFLIEGSDGPDIVGQPVPQDRIYRFDGSKGGWIEAGSA